nr:DUF2382 domain-containing protein [Caballeronia temeraria]
MQTGGVRVYSRVTETPVSESVSLREEHATIERKTVDRPATAADLKGVRFFMNDLAHPHGARFRRRGADRDLFLDRRHPLCPTVQALASHRTSLPHAWVPPHPHFGRICTGCRKAAARSETTAS